MKNDPVERALAALDNTTPDHLAEALRSKYNFVAAKAARIIANRALIDLAPVAQAFSLCKLNQRPAKLLPALRRST